ncbi:MAG: aromatic aminobenezylarsenical efflux permease ArsG family transporter [Candidatus Limimorpha sp.]
MEFLQNLLDSSQLPLFTAFVLGLLTAVSPCPLATNITAIGFISRNNVNADADSKSVKNRVLWTGVLYTAGRCIAYTVLGAALIFIIRKGADTFNLQEVVSKWGEIIIGPALVCIGILMIISEFVNIGSKFGFNGNKWSEQLTGMLGGFILGILFALAFCPTSALLYFGMLIPMSANADAGYVLPFVYAIATSIPVLIVSWVLAYSVQSLGKLLGKFNVIQKWFNRIVATAFVIVGCYYCYIFFFS